MNTLVFNPIVMASAAASVLGAMMCLSLYVVKCAIDKRDAMHEQQYDALYDKCTKLKQKVNTMAKEMSLMRLEAENPNAIHMLEANPEKINWPQLLNNPNAIHLLEANPQNPAIFDMIFDMYETPVLK
jgi:hypothetical protein